MFGRSAARTTVSAVTVLTEFAKFGSTGAYREISRLAGHHPLHTMETPCTNLSRHMTATGGTCTRSVAIVPDRCSGCRERFARNACASGEGVGAGTNQHTEK